MNKKLMMNKFFFIAVSMVLAALPQHTLAQSIKATIEPIEMLIGEQAEVTLTVQAVDSSQVEWPVLRPRQQLVEGVEVINTHHPTATTMTIVLTSFDGKLYHLPPFQVKVDGKTLKTNDLALKVVEVEVDTTKLNEYFGPKSVQENPFLWSEWSLPFWLSVLMLVLIGLTAYLRSRLLAGKPIITRIKIVKRLLPHQKAMKEIEQIKADKMVASEDQKVYYTKLTDTLRRYIEERYGFSAMEMTSAEIITRLMATDDRQRLDELRQLFTTADLVKFAKYSTMINENDANLVSAIDFINQTKLENMPTEEVIKPQLSEEDQRMQHQRRLLKVLTVGAGVAAVVLLGNVIYAIYLLLI